MKRTSAKRMRFTDVQETHACYVVKTHAFSACLFTRSVKRMRFTDAFSWRAGSFPACVPLTCRKGMRFAKRTCSFWFFGSEKFHISKKRGKNSANQLHAPAIRIIASTASSSSLCSLMQLMQFWCNVLLVGRSTVSFFTVVSLGSGEKNCTSRMRFSHVPCEHPISKTHAFHGRAFRGRQ